jgi:hypothetical protein
MIWFTRRDDSDGRRYFVVEADNAAAAAKAAQDKWKRPFSAETMMEAEGGFQIAAKGLPS